MQQQQGERERVVFNLGKSNGDGEWVDRVILHLLEEKVFSTELVKKTLDLGLYGQIYIL